MRGKTILAVPAICFWSVIAVCVTGIVIGSFCDLEISKALADVTPLGTYFATYSPFFAYCLLPAGGVCLYTGLKKRGKPWKNVGILFAVFGWFMAVYFSNSYFSKNVRPMFGYDVSAGTAFLSSAASWLLWAALYAWVPFVVSRLLDDSDPVKLILVGAALLMVCFMADVIMQWLKQVGSRPRYKYLISSKGSLDEFRNWYQMIPHLAGTDDSYMSWPSGHMSIVSVLFALPVLTDCLKNRSSRKNVVAFCLVCMFVLLCGYNRIHMTNHFLSDVCFGVLIVSLITAGICTVCLKPVRKAD